MEENKIKRMSNEALAEEVKSYIDSKTTTLKAELLSEFDVKLENTQHRIWKGLHVSLSEYIENSNHGLVVLINKVLSKVDKAVRK